MQYLHRDMDVRSLLRKPLQCALLALIVMPALGADAVATGTSEIEGVWSFGGGAIAIQRLSNDTYQGTVVSPTTFNTCPHPAGEVLWTNMRQQPDGSFSGLHQWFDESNCEYVTQLGLTAWRVLETTQGAHVLKVCFSEPGGNLQPTIAVNGTNTNTTYGCIESSPLASIPVVSPGGPGDGPSPDSGAGISSGQSGLITFANSVLLPSSAGCIGQKSLKIKLHDPKYDPFKEVVVKIGAKQVADVRGVKRLRSPISIKNLPGGAYKVSVLVTTVLEQKLSGSRTYRTCTKASGTIKLRRRGRPKPHHR